MATPTEKGPLLAVNARTMRSLLAALALALGGCGASKSTGEWIELSKSKDSADRTRAIRELAERTADADAVVPALTAALSDVDAFVRRDAARVLGQFGPNAAMAVPALQTAARDKNQNVRQTALEALRQIAPHVSVERRNGKRTGRSEAASGFAHTTPECFQVPIPTTGRSAFTTRSRSMPSRC